VNIVISATGEKTASDLKIRDNFIIFCFKIYNVKLIPLYLAVLHNFVKELHYSHFLSSIVKLKNRGVASLPKGGRYQWRKPLIVREKAKKQSIAIVFSMERKK
jgi:hypothetical protein